jgi:hypothetical protein
MRLVLDRHIPRQLAARRSKPPIGTPLNIPQSACHQDARDAWHGDLRSGLAAAFGGTPPVCTRQQPTSRRLASFVTRNPSVCAKVPPIFAVDSIADRDFTDAYACPQRASAERWREARCPCAVRPPMLENKQHRTKPCDLLHDGEIVFAHIPG